jgi:hypothetical protein
MQVLMADFPCIKLDVHFYTVQTSPFLFFVRMIYDDLKPRPPSLSYFMTVRWGGGGDGFTALSSWSRKTSDLGLDGFLVRNITLVISFLISASRSLNQYI